MHADWEQSVSAMALPHAGDLLGHTLEWISAPLADQAQEVQLLCGAVGSQFVVTDIEIVRNMVEDNVWTVRRPHHPFIVMLRLFAFTQSGHQVEQLVYVSRQHPHLATRLARSVPHVVNVRDNETGDSLFHSLARDRRAAEIQAWLDNGSVVTPIKNADGQTAVMIAVGRHETSIAQALWRGLACPLNYITASLVAEELKLLARSSPELVRLFLVDIGQKVTQTLTTFRTKMIRHPVEAIGLETPSLPSDVGANGIPQVWTKLLPRDQPEQLVASKVLLLPHILGNTEDSCFHAVSHCSFPHCACLLRTVPCFR
eukprot:SAG31_NODE_1222_length_9294_cov_4.099184_2_plen_314_part_00